MKFSDVCICTNLISSEFFYCFSWQFCIKFKLNINLRSWAPKLDKKQIFFSDEYTNIQIYTSLYFMLVCHNCQENQHVNLDWTAHLRTLVIICSNFLLQLTELVMNIKSAYTQKMPTLTFFAI